MGNAPWRRMVGTASWRGQAKRAVPVLWVEEVGKGKDKASRRGPAVRRFIGTDSATGEGKPERPRLRRARNRGGLPMLEDFRKSGKVRRTGPSSEGRPRSVFASASFMGGFRFG
jgi:hypothetical protein